MTRYQISQAVKDFVAGNIRSVLQLEILLLLHETEDKWWVATEVSERLSIDTEIASTQLLFLKKIGLVRQHDKNSYSYHPKNEKLKLIIDSLAEAYSKQRVAVFSLILRRPDDRGQRFAEAFKLTRSS